MVEANRKPSHIGDIPSECAHLLTPMELKALQYRADGHKLKERAVLLRISEAGVSSYDHNIGFVGQKEGRSFWLAYEYPEQGFHAALALIQDGIAQGYLTHELPQEPIEPLSPREEEVLDLILQGMTNSGIGKKLWISPKTVEIHVNRIHRKLHTRNVYDTTARATYLRVHGMWSTSNGKQG